jgi:hypothetical protein
MTEDTQEVSSRNGPVGEPEPPRRGGGLPLPGLKYWRVRRGLTQAELTRRAALKCGGAEGGPVRPRAWWRGSQRGGSATA